VSLLADTTPLRTPDFRRLWLSGVVTVIGANLTIFAVPVQVYALTQNSAYVGLSGLFALVPLVVFGLWGGAWADAMDRRILLIIASCGLALASLLLWAQAALAANNVWVVLCLLSVQQAFFAINSPTRSAAIPRMLPSDQLPAANSLNMTVFQFGAIVGPLLAGVLLRFMDLSTLYLLDAITCAAPIWATVRLSPMPATETAADGSSRRGFGAVWDGFRYLAGNTVVLMSFVVDLIAMIFGMPRALFPQIAHTRASADLSRAAPPWRCWRPRSRRAPSPAGCSPAGCHRSGARALWSSPRSWCGGWRWSGSVCSAVSRTEGQAPCCGPRWRSWRWAGLRTWCRRRSGRRSCSRRHPTMCGDGCRACSPSLSPAVRGWPTRSTVALRRSSAPPSPRPAVARSWLSAC
jgi:hypothetical protein